MSKHRKGGARRTASGSRGRRAKPAKARKLAPPVPAAPADRGLQPPEGGRRVRGKGADRSVQDPLGDWPETDADRWLLDREGEDVETPEE